MHERSASARPEIGKPWLSFWKLCWLMRQGWSRASMRCVGAPCTHRCDVSHLVTFLRSGLVPHLRRVVVRRRWVVVLLKFRAFSVRASNLYMPADGFGEWRGRGEPMSQPCGSVAACRSGCGLYPATRQHRQRLRPLLRCRDLGSHASDRSSHFACWAPPDGKDFAARAARAVLAAAPTWLADFAAAVGSVAVLRQIEQGNPSRGGIAARYAARAAGYATDAAASGRVS